MPDLLVFSTISPIMFILLFAYVFGSAITAGPGIGYREFLIPGIFAQTVIFGATITGAGLADDMQKGIIDRFRSLPMSRSAVLVGRTDSDVLNNVLVDRDHVGHRPARRLAHPLVGRRGDRRLPAAAGLRLRDLVDHGAASGSSSPARRSSTTPRSSSSSR